MTYNVLMGTLNPTHSLARFPGEPGLAGFIEVKDDGGRLANWSYKRGKLQSSCHHLQTNTQLLCPSCRTTNSVTAPSSPGGLPTLSL